MIAPRLPPGRFPGSHRYSEAAFFLTSGLPIDTKLSFFYFHDVLEQPKTNFHTYFLFKWVLGFAIEYA